MSGFSTANYMALAWFALAWAGYFNRGPRAFFLAIGYLGWFINAYVLAVATAVVVLVLLNRQLGTAAHKALPE